MITDKTSETLKLKDGRTLGYAEWGESAGKPVIHFHGSSSSRLEHPPHEDMLKGVRFITVDRPGHGLSDFQPKRRLLDWPDDVSALADHLGLDKFAVSGWSFGGPYAIACAYKIPDRLSAAGLVSSFAPYDRAGATEGMASFNKLALGMARRMPWWFTRRFMKMQGNALQKDPEGVANQMLSSVPESDQKIFTDQSAKDVLLPAMSEAYRSGADGAGWDAYMLVRPWGFRLEDISITVHIWHGDADVNNPLPSFEYLRDTIPNTHVTLFPEEGHFFVLKRWGEVLETLIQ